MGWPGPMTDRQFRAWHAWLDEDLNQPGKVEAYLMRVAAEVRASVAKDPSSIKLDDFKVRFGKPTYLSQEEATRRAKDKWQPAIYNTKPPANRR